MAEQYANDVQTTLASPGATSGATSINIASATGWPTLGAGDWVRARIQTDSNTPSPFELILVTARSGTSLSTVARGQEGTTARAWSTGASISIVPTAATLGGLAPLDSPAFTGTPTISGSSVATDDDVAALAAAHATDKGLSIGLCIEVTGTYPTRPSGFGMVQFRGVDDPNALGLMVEGDDWVDLS